MQETHVAESKHFIRDGFLIILSGTEQTHEGYLYSGVGFMIAPSAIKAIICFKLLGDRLATLKIKVEGGILNLMTVYAPHAGKDYELRKMLFDKVGKAWTPHGDHNCTIALGDWGRNTLEKMM